MQNTVNKLGIRFLVHFTQAKNLKSIVKYGILPKNELSSRCINHAKNDKYRIDGYHDSSSFSIEWPNYKMFYPLRLNSDTDWVVIGINKNVLWNKECIFCWDNAASSEIIRTPRESMVGTSGLLRLYEEVLEKPTRREITNSGVRESQPINPQSEVLISGCVEPSNIFAIGVENKYTYEKYKETVPDSIPLQVKEWLFKPRQDYEHWL